VNNEWDGYSHIKIDYLNNLRTSKAEGKTADGRSKFAVQIIDIAEWNSLKEKEKLVRLYDLTHK